MLELSSLSEELASSVQILVGAFRVPLVRVKEGEVSREAPLSTLTAPQTLPSVFKSVASTLELLTCTAALPQF